MRSLASLAPAFREGITASSGKIEVGLILDSASAQLVVDRLIKTSKHIVTSEDLVRGSEAVLKYSTYQLERKSDLLYAASAIAAAARLPASPDLLSFQRDTAIDVLVGYSRLWRRAQGNAHRAIISMIGYLMTPSNCLSSSATSSGGLEVVDTVMSVLMVRTLSRLVPGEILEAAPFDPITGAADDHLYAVYITMWDALWGNGGAVVESTQSSLLRISLRYLQDLDLSYDSTAAELGDAIPKNIADQELLLNLISFLESFLTVDRGSDWNGAGAVILTRFVDLSKQYPLVSALYRGIRLLLCLQTKTFEQYEATLGAENASPLRVVLLPFLIDLSHKVASFQQELLSSALQLLLCAPAVKVLPFKYTCESCIVAIKSDSCVQLAIDALEYFVGSPELVERLDDVVPPLNKYLTLSKGASGAVDAKNGLGASSEPLAFSTLRFFGRLGGYNKAILVDPSVTTSSDNRLDAASTFAGRSIGIRFGPHAASLGFSGSLALDGTIPRLLELCRQSGGQQVRTTAAECLHSIIVIMIGQSVTDPSYRKSADNEKSKFSDMYRDIFPVAITLAVSSEPATRKLFEACMLQLAHLFSSNQQVVDADATGFVDVLLNSLSRSNESEVVSFVTKLIEEFTVWCIRQSSPTELVKLGSKSASKLDAVLRKLVAFASHPLSSVRIGAGNALSRLCRTLMKETALLTRYGLMIAHSLMLSMRFEASEVRSFIIYLFDKQLHMVEVLSFICI